MGSYGVTAASNTVGVDARGVAFTHGFAAVAVPGISQGVLGIEIASGCSGGNRLSHHYFAGLHGATRSGRHGLRASPPNHDAALQS